MKYRKKPIEIEAIRFKGDNASDIKLFFDSNAHLLDLGQDFAFIQTLNGLASVKKGEWIIKGIEGEFYPCSHEIFKKTYEEVLL